MFFINSQRSVRWQEPCIFCWPKWTRSYWSFIVLKHLWTNLVESSEILTKQMLCIVRVCDPNRRDLHLYLVNLNNYVTFFKLIQTCSSYLCGPCHSSPLSITDRYEQKKNAYGKLFHDVDLMSHTPDAFLLKFVFLYYQFLENPEADCVSLYKTDLLYYSN